MVELLRSARIYHHEVREEFRGAVRAFLKVNIDWVINIFAEFHSYPFFSAATPRKDTSP
jgi:hypothetical protein